MTTKNNHQMLCFFVLLFVCQWSLAQNTKTAAPEPCKPSFVESHGMVLYRFYRFGCGVSPVRVEKAPDAKFPEELRKKYKSEVVVYSINVGEHGIEGWHIISFPNPKLVGPAADAIKNYKFSPATLKGKPVLTDVIAEIQVSDGKLRTPLKQPY